MQTIWRWRRTRERLPCTKIGRTGMPLSLDRRRWPCVTLSVDISLMRSSVTAWLQSSMRPLLGLKSTRTACWTSKSSWTTKICGVSISPRKTFPRIGTTPRARLGTPSLTVRRKALRAYQQAISWLARWNTRKRSGHSLVFSEAVDSKKNSSAV